MLPLARLPMCVKKNWFSVIEGTEQNRTGSVSCSQVNLSVCVWERHWANQWDLYILTHENQRALVSVGFDMYTVISAVYYLCHIALDGVHRPIWLLPLTREHPTGAVSCCVALVWKRSQIKMHDGNTQSFTEKQTRRPLLVCSSLYRSAVGYVQTRSEGEAVRQTHSHTFQ